MYNIPDADGLNELLTALAEQLGARGEPHELVVVGGSGLLALDIVNRGTKDVDVVARIEAGALIKGSPLPATLVAARDAVARDFGVSNDWLNAGPADLVDFGLPRGFLERVDTRLIGGTLTVHFASRFDQIHFKLYAWSTRASENTSRTSRPFILPAKNCSTQRVGLAPMTHQRRSARCSSAPWPTSE